jgi:hypothetical protein
MVSSLNVTSPSGQMAGNGPVRLFATVTGMAAETADMEYWVRWTSATSGVTITNPESKVYRDPDIAGAGYIFDTLVNPGGATGSVSLTAEIYQLDTTTGDETPDGNGSKTFTPQAIFVANRTSDTESPVTGGSAYDTVNNIHAIVEVQEAGTGDPVGGIDVLWRTDYYVESNIFLFTDAGGQFDAADKIVYGIDTASQAFIYAWLVPSDATTGRSGARITATRPYKLRVEPYISGYANWADLTTPIYFVSTSYAGTGTPLSVSVAPDGLRTNPAVDYPYLQLDQKKNQFIIVWPTQILSMSATSGDWFLVLNNRLAAYGPMVPGATQTVAYADLLASIPTLANQTDWSKYLDYLQFFIQDFTSRSLTYSPPFQFVTYGQGLVNQPEPTPDVGKRDQSLPQALFMYLGDGIITPDTLDAGQGLMVKLPAAASVAYPDKTVTVEYYMNGFVNGTQTPKHRGPNNTNYVLTGTLSTDGKSVTVTLPKQYAEGFGADNNGVLDFSYVDYWIDTDGSGTRAWGPYPTTKAPTNTAS